MMSGATHRGWLRGRLVRAGCVLAVLLAGIAAYYNALGLPLLRIEQQTLYGTPSFQRIDTAITAATPSETSPLARASYGLVGWITGGAPSAHRGLGIALHLAGALALYGITRRLFRQKLPEPVAALPGLIFAVHPGAGYLANYLLARDALLASTLALLALWLYLCAAEPRRPLRPLALAASYAAFVLAWTAGPQAFVVPVLTPLCDWLARGRQPRPWKALAGYWAVLGGLSAAYPAPWLTLRDAPAYGERFSALFNYLRMTATGQGFALIHGYKTGNPLAGQMPLLGLSIALGALVIGAFLLARRHPAGLALIWFTFAAGAGLAAAGPEGYTEAPLYLALAGLLLIVPWAMKLALRNQTILFAGGGALALLIAVAGAGTAARNGFWGMSELALWNEASDAAPGAYLPAVEAGRIHAERGMAAQMAANQPEERRSPMETGMGPVKEGSLAEEYLRRAIDLRPGLAEPWRLLGQSLLLQDKPEEARKALLAALERAPRDRDNLASLAAFHQQQASAADTFEQRREALAASVRYFERARDLRILPGQLVPVYASSVAGLGNLPAARQLFDRLAEQEEAAGLEQSPARQQARELANVLNQAQLLRSRAQDQAAARPALASLLEGEALAIERRWLPASYALAAALRQDPGLADAWLFLGLTRASMGQIGSFLERHPLPPGGSEDPWMQLAQMCMGNGRWDAAEACFEHAAQRGVLELPLLAMADAALALRQGRAAFDYYNRAMEAYPSRPEPALRLFDVAAANNDIVRARGYLSEAEKRGATAAQLAPRREQLTAQPSTADGGRTVIR